MTTGEQMDMEVRHRLARVRAMIDREPEATGESELSRHHAGHHEQMAEHGLVGRLSFADPGDDSLGNDQQMNGRLRLNVMDDDAELVLVFDPGRNFAINDFLEECLGHGS